MSSRLALLFVLLAAPGCVPRSVFEPAVPRGTSQRAIESEGYTRTYRVHEGGGSRPRALLVVLHGAGSSAASMEETTGFDAVADEAGLSIAYADGLGLFGWARMWNAGDCCGRPRMLGIDDVAVVRAIVQAEAARASLGRDRVFVVGYSNGAMLAYRAAAELSDWIGGVAAFAGSMRTRGPVEAPDFELVSRRPMAVLVAHGEDDPRVAISGEDGSPWSSASSAAVARRWAYASRCRAKPSVRIERGGAVRVETFTDCAPGAPVERVMLRGWDHEWPGPLSTSGLPETHPLRGYDLARTIWSFFDASIRK